MKKYVILFAASLVFAGVSSAQVVEEVDSEKELIEEKEDLRAANEQALKAAEKATEKQLDAFEEATEDLQDANDEYNEARQAYKDAENQLENARARYRQARRDMNEERKRQNPIQIDRYEVNVNPILEDMSKGTNYGYTTFLEGSEGGGLLNISKNAETEFKKFLSQYKAGKVKRTKGELFFDNIIIPQVSSYTMDVYVDFAKEDSGVNLRTYFDLGEKFLNGTQSSSADKAVRRLLEDFARSMRYKELEDQLKDQEKEQQKLQKDIEKYRKDASQARDDIQKNEEDIIEAIAKAEEAELLLEQQMDKVEFTRMKMDKVN